MPSVTLSTSVPTSVSLEEHRALVGSTPASFNDIPPILRHKEENVSVTLDPPLDGFSEQDGAQGTLYVIERQAAALEILPWLTDVYMVAFWFFFRPPVVVSRSNIQPSFFTLFRVHIRVPPYIVS
jgi:hypothetical protein